MRHWPGGMLAALLLAGAAHAQTAAPTSTPAPAPTTAQIVAQGGPGGTPACSTCHGANGLGNEAAGFPRLAGDPTAYLSEQLAAFASGARTSAVMGPIAKSLDAAQMQAVAAYFAALPAPAPNAAKAAALPGAVLALDGRDAGRLPACVACHGPDGIGVAPSFPALAGQPAAYLVAQIEAWQQGHRPPGPLGLMPAIAKRLSPAEAAAVAAYFASLGAP